MLLDALRAHAIGHAEEEIGQWRGPGFDLAAPLKAPPPEPARTIGRLLCEWRLPSALQELNDGNLTCKGKDGNESKLIALSEAAFNLEDYDLMKMEFVKTSSGKIDEVKFIFDDGFETIYKRKE